MNEEEIVRKRLKKLANSIFSKLNDVEKSYLLMVNNEKNKQTNELKQELKRKDNIIKSLISYLETQINDYKEMGYNQSKIREKDLWMAGQYDEDIFILDKIKELESK